MTLPRGSTCTERKTSPEELLAAAHAACFIDLARERARAAGAPPERMVVRCTITMDEVEGRGHRIVASAIEATAWAPGADAELLDGRRVEADEAGCPFSALIRASADVSVEPRHLREA